MRRYPIWLAVIGVCCALAGCKDEKKEKEKAEAEALVSVADGAMIYFQEEHAGGADGMDVFSRRYPVSTETVCSKDDAELFEKLRYSDDVNVCYRTDANGKRFAAWLESGMCVSGSAGGGEPEVSDIEDGGCEDTLD